MKACFVCSESKPIEEFYAHPGMSDGHLNKCKTCAKKQADDRRKQLEVSDLEWREKELARHRAKSLNRTMRGLRGKLRPELENEWRRRNPEKYKAHRMVANALKKGDLITSPCFCGEEKVEAHHDDYSQPLNVRWLCRKHHMALHTEINIERRKKEFLEKTYYNNV